MSKSKGGFLTLDTLVEKGYLPAHYKYFCLTSHYRSSAIFSEEAMDSAKKAYDNLVDYVSEFKAEAVNKELTSSEVDDLAKLKDEFNAYLFDDLKTPMALSYMWGVVKDNQKSAALKLAFILHVDSVLQLFLAEVAPKKAEKIEVTPEISALLEARAAARAAKDWTKSDEIRDRLAALGIGVKDLPNKEIELIRL
jgi:cysteinyl-tRNA synthetase